MNLFNIKRQKSKTNNIYLSNFGIPSLEFSRHKFLNFEQHLKLFPDYNNIYYKRHKTESQLYTNEESESAETSETMCRSGQIN